MKVRSCLFAGLWSKFRHESCGWLVEQASWQLRLWPLMGGHPGPHIDAIMIVGCYAYGATASRHCLSELRAARKLSFAELGSFDWTHSPLRSGATRSTGMSLIFALEAV